MPSIAPPNIKAARSIRFPVTGSSRRSIAGSYPPPVQAARQSHRRWASRAGRPLTRQLALHITAPIYVATGMSGRLFPRSSRGRPRSFKHSCTAKRDLADIVFLGENVDVRQAWLAGGVRKQRSAVSQTSAGSVRLLGDLVVAQMLVDRF